jgi:hypothetical protein
MHILIIDQCSGSKEIPDTAPSFGTEEIDEYRREELITRDGVPAIPARRLYTGRQQRYIDSAVDQLRDAGDTVDRLFISAGFGLVTEETELPTYNVTFAEMNATDIDERAALLNIPGDVREVIRRSPPYDLVVLALGSDYYRACDLESVLDQLPDTTYGVVFNQEALADGRENVVSIAARTSEAKAQGTIVVALKGRYLQNFAAHRSGGKTVELIEDVTEFMESEPTTQAGLGEYE